MKKSVKSKPIIIGNQLLRLLKDPTRFKKLEDGWIRDNLLGVEWGKSSEQRMKWKEAKEYCAKLGGRLPEVNELQSLVNYSKYDPAIDTDLFPDTKSSWYWTGTEVAGDSYYAWVVVFYYGSVDTSSKDGSFYVRPVRASQCSAV
jgi:hypothetical protein